MFFSRRVKALLYPEDEAAIAADIRTGSEDAAQFTLPFPASGWMKLVDTTAEEIRLGFDIGSILSYFMSRKEADGLPAENMRSVSSRSYGLYKKGYCRDAEVVLENGSHGLQLFLKCFCKAEMKTRERYEIKMVVTSSDSKLVTDIAYAYCQCKAGLGPKASCKHIAAVSYGLEEFTRRNIFTGITCSTSDLQKWNAPPSKRVCSEISFSVPVFRKQALLSARANFDPRPESLQSTSPDDERNKLRQLLSKCPGVKPALLDTLPISMVHLPGASVSTPSAAIQEDVSTHISTVSELVTNFKQSPQYKENIDNPPIGKWCTALRHQIALPPRLRYAVEWRTRGQGKNPLWKEHRYGRITASNFGKVVMRKAPAGPLVKFFLYDAVPSLPSLAYGVQHEDDARKQYIHWCEEHGRQVVVKESGLVLTAEGFLGCSPDGIVYEPRSQEQGLLEIKCPSSAADLSLKEVAEKANFFALLNADGQLLLKKSHQYFYQVQGAMGIMDLLWCDFVIWSPRFFSVERITFDHDLWAEMKEKLVYFFDHWLLPELILRKYPKTEIEEVLY